MAGLPPRPESPPRDRHDRRYPPIEHDRRGIRPLASHSRFRDAIPESERVYVPRRTESDTYIAPPYDRRDGDRRPADYDRRPYGRDRERPRGWEADHSRDTRPYDRDRRRPDDSYVPGAYPPDHRDSRTYPSSPRRPPPRSHRSRSPPYRRYSRSPYRRSRSPSRRSRSPPRRRSPPPYRRPPRSRSRSRSPRKTPFSPKTIRLGNHSISAGSRPHSPYIPPRDRQASERPRPDSPRDAKVSSTPLVGGDRCSVQRPTQSKTPELVKTEDRDSAINIKAGSAPNEGRRQETPTSPAKYSTVQQENEVFPVVKAELPPPTSRSTDILPKVEKHPSPAPTLSSYRQPTDSGVTPLKQASPIPHIGSKETKHESPSPVQDRIPIDILPHSRDRSHSPPRQPRNMPAGPPRGILPRGPRTHPRNPGPPPSLYSPYPTGPRRRYQHGPSSPATYSQPHATLGPSSMFDPSTRPSLPLFPTYNRPKSITHDVDLELSRLEAHRTHLTADYRQQEKVARRALHELDMATIDLRAAEGRRKIADGQLEKAKVGALGIDAIITGSPVL